MINVAARRRRMTSPGAPYSSSTSSSDSSGRSRPRFFSMFRRDASFFRKQRVEQAIRRSDLVMLQRLFGLNPEMMERPLRSCDVCTPLLFAIRSESAEVVRWLIDQGAKLDAVPCYRHRPPVYRGKWLAFVPFMVASSRALNGVLDLVLSTYLALVGNPFSNGPSAAEGPWTLFGANPLHAAVLSSNDWAVPIIMKHIEQFKRTYK